MGKKVGDIFAATFSSVQIDMLWQKIVYNICEEEEAGYILM